MKALVVYYSRKGYVRKMAQKRAEELGAELLELKTAERTQGIAGFWWCGRFGMHRWGMKLLPFEQELCEYDKLVICSPVWVFSVCAPVREFVQLAAGKVRSADYMLAHFSFPMRYTKTLAWLDKTLGVRHGRFTSVCCMCGKIIRSREFA